MALFGFKSKRKVEEELQQEVAQAMEQGRQQAIRDNLTDLSNLSKGSQVNFAIPYFDVYDPRFMDQGVPVSVHGSIVYSIDDMDLFHQINKNEAYSDETFKNKLKGQVTKFVKGVVSNAPSDAQIPVVQLERKIMEISELVHKYVAPKVEQLFGITVRSLDVTSINVDKESRAFRELKALTADLERERTMSQHSMHMEMLQKQHKIGMEMSQMQTVEQMRMQMEDQKERMRLQREGMQQQIKEGRFRLGAVGGMQQPTMGGMQQPMMGGMQQPTMGGIQPPMPGAMPPAPPAPAMRQFHVLINGQQAGPFDGNVLQQMAQQGTLTAQSQVWAPGMAQWALAVTVPELAALFATSAGAPVPPPVGGTTPPPASNGSIPAPTL